MKYWSDVTFLYDSASAATHVAFSWKLTSITTMGSDTPAGTQALYHIINIGGGILAGARLRF